MATERLLELRRLAELRGVDVPRETTAPGGDKIAPTPVDEPESLLDKAKGVGEAGLTLATGAAGVIPAAAAGAGSAVTGGLQSGLDRFKEFSHNTTYQPRGQAGQRYIGNVAQAIDDSKLAGMNPAVGIEAAALSRPVGVAARGRSAAKGIGRSAEMAINTPQPKAIVGMGSAMTPAERMRMERAANLPVPIQLTRGQAGRTFEQQQFERETAKNPTSGEPLRQRFAEQNAKILQNFDAFIDQTGAQSGGLRATGQIVSDAVVNKAKRAKSEVDAAYTKARESGAMTEPVPVQSVVDFLESKRPQFRNAGVLESTLDELNAAQKKTPGVVSLNELEEIRKGIGAAGGKDATNAHWAKELKKQIDAITENRGGADYKRARGLRTKYAKEFEDVGVIDRLMSTKPNSSDRRVGYEDVFQHSILSGTLDDVRAVRRTLQTAGKEGEQAWRELQGATMQHLKSEITKGVTTDTKGNKVVSAARLDSLVNELDKDGKLDFIFGKKGGQQIRDVNDLAKDVYTAPPGSVNTSNTASILIGLLDTAVSGTAGLPLPIGTALNQGVKAIKKRSLDKRVQSALNPQGAIDRAGIGVSP